jgi:hypothetical protein
MKIAAINMAFIAEMQEISLFLLKILVWHVDGNR